MVSKESLIPNLLGTTGILAICKTYVKHMFYTFMGTTRSKLEMGPCGKQGNK